MKTDKQIIETIEKIGSEPFKLDMSKQALFTIKTIENFDFKDFKEWLKKDLCISFSHVKRYLDSKGINLLDRVR